MFLLIHWLWPRRVYFIRGKVGHDLWPVGCKKHSPPFRTCSQEFIYCFHPPFHYILGPNANCGDGSTKYFELLNNCLGQEPHVFIRLSAAPCSVSSVVDGRGMKAKPKLWFYQVFSLSLHN